LPVGKSVGNKKNIITNGSTDGTDVSVIIFFITNGFTEGNSIGNYLKTLKKFHFIKL